MTKRNTPNKKRAQKKPMEFSDGIDHLAAEAKEARSLEDLLGF
jgi:hypothetical protein